MILDARRPKSDTECILNSAKYVVMAVHLTLPTAFSSDTGDLLVTVGNSESLKQGSWSLKLEQGSMSCALERMRKLIMCVH